MPITCSARGGASDRSGGGTLHLHLRVPRLRAEGASRLPAGRSAWRAPVLCRGPSGTTHRLPARRRVPTLCQPHQQLGRRGLGPPGHRRQTAAQSHTVGRPGQPLVRHPARRGLGPVPGRAAQASWRRTDLPAPYWQNPQAVRCWREGTAFAVAPLTHPSAWVGINAELKSRRRASWPPGWGQRQYRRGRRRRARPWP